MKQCTKSFIKTSHQNQIRETFRLYYHGNTREVVIRQHTTTELLPSNKLCYQANINQMAVCSFKIYDIRFGNESGSPADKLVNADELDQ